MITFSAIMASNSLSILLTLDPDLYLLLPVFLLFLLLILLFLTNDPSLDLLLPLSLL